MRQLLAGILFAQLTSLCLAGGPSTSAPDDMLSVRPQKRSEDLLQDTLKLQTQIDKELELYENKLAGKRYKVGTLAEMKNISETNTKIRQHRRLAELLTTLGEPAGIDARYRNDLLAVRSAAVVRDFMLLPETPALMKRSINGATGFVNNKADALAPLEKVLAQNKVENVERAFFELWDAAEEPLLWQAKLLAGQLRAPFVEFDSKLTPELEKLRSEQAKELILPLRAKQLPPFARFLENVDAAVTSVSETGAAAWGGEERAGPELVTAWLVGWRQAHLMSLRAQALTWSLPPETELDPPDTLGQDYADFHTRMIAACAALVEADAARVDAAEVPDLYARYLAAFAGIIPRMSDDSLRSAIEPALANLRDKSPEYALTVAAYERATSQALHWRQRKAAAWRRRHQISDAALLDLLQRAARPDAMVARKGAEARVDTLLVAAPLLVQDVSQITTDKFAVVERVAPNDELPTCRSRLQTYCFAEAAKIDAPLAEIDELKADLLISPAAPPLTLDAAIAVATAELGYFQAIGGNVTSAEVDSRQGRVIHLEDDDILPVGSLPTNRPDDPLTELVWRVELTPKWAQHKYFFILSP